MNLNFKNLQHKLVKLLSRVGLGKGKRYNLEDAFCHNLKLDNLHLGCGNVHINNWCNVDVLETGATDLILDIKTLPGIPDSSVFKIYSCHVLEHFPTNQILKILTRWHEVLQSGGELRISVPDLDSITRIYQKNIDHFNTPGNQPWIALIYGGQKDQFDFHKTGFNFCWLSYLLMQAGFREVSRYPCTPHFVDGVIDNSSAHAPFGEFISLNVIAVK